ncbi:MAG: LysM peptidoglycan-binding domain-containing protein [Acidimicrobiales bacterium]
MSTAQNSLVKAKLEIQEPKADGSNKKVDLIEFQFNPKEWSITRSAEWKVEQNRGGVGAPEYKGPNPASVTVEMFLDATDSASGDISKTIDKLMKCVAPESKSQSNRAPSAPHVLFQWGDAVTFKGYVESIAVKYTMFRGKGTPIRGSATLTIKEFPKVMPAQNPTSGGPPGNRLHRVIEGDTLASIAYAELGDPTRWREIADANPVIADPMRLPAGERLLIPRT